MKSATRWFLTAVFLVLAPSIATGLENEDCLGCQEDPELTGERDNQEISVYINPDTFATSVHGDLACDDCHADLVGLDVSTRQGVSLGRVERLMETGANDVLVIRGEREYLVPYIPGQYVLGIDVQAGTMVVDWDPEF